MPAIKNPKKSNANNILNNKISNYFRRRDTLLGEDKIAKSSSSEVKSVGEIKMGSQPNEDNIRGLESQNLVVLTLTDEKNSNYEHRAEEDLRVPEGRDVTLAYRDGENPGGRN